MDAKVNETTGSLKISEEVIADIAKQSVKEVKGFNSFSHAKANIKEIALKSDAKSSVKITLNGGVAEINLSVILDAGAKVKDVCKNIQNTVKENVQSMTSVAVSKVNVYVSDVATGE